MRRLEDAADRSGEAVHGAEPGVRQAEAAEQACQRERLAIGRRHDDPPSSRGVGAPKRRRRAPEPFPGEPVGEGVRPGARRTAR